MALAMLVVAVDPVLVVPGPRRDDRDDRRPAGRRTAGDDRPGADGRRGGRDRRGRRPRRALPAEPAADRRRCWPSRWLAVGPGTLRGRVARASALLAAVAATLAPLGDPERGGPRRRRSGRRPTAATRCCWRTIGSITTRSSNGPMDVWSGPNQRAWFDRVTPLAVGKTGAGVGPDVPVGWRCGDPRPAGRLRAGDARPARAVLGDRAVGGGLPGADPLGDGGLDGAALGRCWSSACSRRPGRTWPGVAAWSAILALTAVHAFFWTDLRMRAPIVPAIALCGGRGGRAGRHARPLGA